MICNCDKPYKKLIEDEEIHIGDVISLNPIENKVRLAFNRFKKQEELVIGICTKIENNIVYVANKGIVDINVKGIICIGDKLTCSTEPGIACALKYDSIEEKQFGIRSLGKVVGLYNVYNKAKILLDIE